MMSNGNSIVVGVSSSLFEEAICAPKLHACDGSVGRYWPYFTVPALEVLNIAVQKHVRCAYTQSS